MRVKMNYFGQLRQLAGRDGEELDLEEGTDLKAALALVAGRHPPAFGGLLVDDEGKPRVSILAQVNQELVEPGAGRVLREGDEVDLITPIAGGSRGVCPPAETGCCPCRN